eukprot:CAMPEP_0119036512 /NCGR_PEP_ID=MMETSP1177-20130426/4251_1 /TAXON_ID=2985 /ORGANISM="Ochromonas sp, Strain CCMP1899" /LENGTH=697 /DNA_ID=CAMNT_0006996477 /DNA_START=75 /DNA_END=2169 /DNA_ORIENTATION=-
MRESGDLEAYPLPQPIPYYAFSRSLPPPPTPPLPPSPNSTLRREKNKAYYRNARERKQSQIDGLQGRIQELEGQVTDKQSQMDGLQSRIQELDGQNRKQRKDKVHLGNRLQQQLNELAHQKNVMTEQRMAAESSDASNLVKAMDVNEQMVHLSGELVKAQEALECLKNENDSKQSTVSKLVKEKNDLKNENKHLEECCEAFSQKLSEMQDDLSTRKQTITAHEAVEADHKSTIRKLKEHFTTLNKHIDNLEVAKESLENDMVNKMCLKEAEETVELRGAEIIRLKSINDDLLLDISNHEKEAKESKQTISRHEMTVEEHSSVKWNTNEKYLLAGADATSLRRQLDQLNRSPNDYWFERDNSNSHSDGDNESDDVDDDNALQRYSSSSNSSSSSSSSSNMQVKTMTNDTSSSSIASMSNEISRGGISESVAEDECDNNNGYDEDKFNSGTDTGIHSDEDTDDDYDSGSQLMREDKELRADDYGDYADYDVDQEEYDNKEEYDNGTGSELDPDVADNDIDDDHEPPSSSSKSTADSSSKSTGSRFDSSSSSTKSRKRNIEQRDESVADNRANGTDHGIDEHEIDSITNIEYSNGKFDGNTIDSRNIKDGKRIRVRPSKNLVVETSSKRTSTLSASSTNQKKKSRHPLQEEYKYTKSAHTGKDFADVKSVQVAVNLFVSILERNLNARNVVAHLFVNMET